MQEDNYGKRIKSKTSQKTIKLMRVADTITYLDRDFYKDASINISR